MNIGVSGEGAGGGPIADVVGVVDGVLLSSGGHCCVCESESESQATLEWEEELKGERELGS